MTATDFGVLVALLGAAGVGLSLNASLEFILDLFRKQKRSRLVGMLSSKRKPIKPLTENEILGLDRVPWPWLYGLSTCLGFSLYLFVGPLVPLLRMALPAAPGVIYLGYLYLRQQRKRAIAGQVRQFLVDLRMLLTVHGSLLLALEGLAKKPAVLNPITRCLAKAFQGGRPRNGMEVLEGLAEQVKSPDLDQALDRIRAAQHGSLDIDEALAKSIDEISEELNTQVEEQIQQLPTRMTFLAVPFLLGPIVIILLYPLADRVLKTLAGAYGAGGGF